jgi:hypothetical protein
MAVLLKVALLGVLDLTLLVQCVHTRPQRKAQQRQHNHAAHSDADDRRH